MPRRSFPCLCGFCYGAGIAWRWPSHVPRNAKIHELSNTVQARRQDLTAGGAHIFKILYWMYAATRRPTVKWGGTAFKWGSRGPLAPPRWRRPWHCDTQQSVASRTKFLLCLPSFDGTFALGYVFEDGICSEMLMSREYANSSCSTVQNSSGDKFFFCEKLNCRNVSRLGKFMIYENACKLDCIKICILTSIVTQFHI